MNEKGDLRGSEWVVIQRLSEERLLCWSKKEVIKF